MAFQRSAELYWTPCDTDERWFYYTFDSGSVQDVPTGLIETCKWNANDNVINGCALTSREISGAFTAERDVTFDEAKSLMQVEGDERDDDMTPPNNSVQDHLAVDDDAEDDWDLQNILTFGAIDVQSIMHGDLLTIQEKCRLFGLDVPVTLARILYCSLGAKHCRRKP